LYVLRRCNVWLQVPHSVGEGQVVKKECDDTFEPKLLPPSSGRNRYQEYEPLETLHDRFDCRDDVVEDVVVVKGSQSEGILKRRAR
jgi:hypothetical protein